MFRKFILKPGLVSRFFSYQGGAVIKTEECGIRTVTLNSPKTRNSLSKDMLPALEESFRNAGSVRCIVLNANGPVFSSGHNLKELASQSHEERQRIFEKCGQLMMDITNAPVPVLAAVDGLAAAAGCQLIAACDIVIATRKSQFSTPGANFGLFCCGPGVAVSRSVGRKGSAMMLLAGLPVSAEQALRLGLISDVCDNDKLDETVDKYVNAIVDKSQVVIELGKKFFHDQLSMDTATAYRAAAREMADNLSLQDGQEGLRSFIEKRKAVWKHQK